MKHTLKEIVAETWKEVKEGVPCQMGEGLIEAAALAYALPTIGRRMADKCNLPDEIETRISRGVQFAKCCMAVAPAMYGFHALNNEYSVGAAIGVFAATNAASYLYEKIRKAKKNLDEEANKYQSQIDKSK